MGVEGEGWNSEKTRRGNHPGEKGPKTQKGGKFPRNPTGLSQRGLETRKGPKVKEKGKEVVKTTPGKVGSKTSNGKMGAENSGE